MRQTRPVAVLLLVTAALVAFVMHAGDVGLGPITLMLLLSATPLVAVLASARTLAPPSEPQAKDTPPRTWPPTRPVADPLPVGTVRTGVAAVVLIDAGFALTQLTAAVGDLGSGGGRLHPEPLAAAVIVLLAGQFLVLLTADQVFPALDPHDLTWAATGRWARANARPIALTTVGVVAVVSLGWALAASPGQRISNGTAVGDGYAPEPARGMDPGLVQAVIVDTIPDPALRACVSAAAQRAPSPGQGLTDLMTLTCSGTDSTVKITSLQGLQQLTNLETLDLSGNRLQELSPLIGMTALRKLDLSDNQITGVEALGRVPGLVRLTLTGNRISDPSPLQDLPALTMLDIADNRIADAGDLVKCPEVDELWIGGNPITDVTVLRSMPSLLGVDLTGIDSTRLTGVDVLRAKRVYVGGLA